eukprot:365547-Chlamydomonas_euryale.AAC.5
MTGLLTGWVGRDPVVKSPDLTAIPVNMTPYVNWLLQRTRHAAMDADIAIRKLVRTLWEGHLAGDA